MNPTLGPRVPSWSQLNANRCRSYGALADHAVRLAISMALLTELFDWLPPTLRLVKAV